MATPDHRGRPVALLTCDWQIELVDGAADPIRAHTDVAELHHAFVLRRSGSTM